MGLFIYIHYQMPFIWPGILRIMSFNGVDSNNTWKVVDREIQGITNFNLGTKIFFVFELHPTGKCT